MFKESFISRRPSHFNVNPLIKAFILSEMFLWSAWNFVIPIFAIFAANEIQGGNVKVAASTYSTYLIVRVITELLAGKYLSGKKDAKKIINTIIGTFIVAVSFIGFGLSNTALPLFIFFGTIGIGMGVSAPAKYSLFSCYLDKGKEALEWSIYDAVTFTGMALSAVLGGFIAAEYGFKLLFFLVSLVNFMAIIPYLVYFRFILNKRTLS